LKKINEVISKESKHSVSRDKALGTKFYVMEVIEVHDSYSAEVEDIELLLSNNQNIKGEIRSLSHHLNSSTKRQKFRLDYTIFHQCHMY